MTRKREVVREVIVVVPRRGVPVRLLAAVVLIAAALAVLWGSLFRGELAAIELPATPDALTTPSAQAGNQTPGVEPIQPAPAEPTTTTAPRAAADASAAAQPDSPAPAPPAGASDAPDQAAQAWYAHRLDVPADAVEVLQLPRCDHNTFHAFVTTEKAGRQHGALLEIVRVDGNFWRFSRIIHQHEVCG